MCGKIRSVQMHFVDGCASLVFLGLALAQSYNRSVPLWLGADHGQLARIRFWVHAFAFGEIRMQDVCSDAEMIALINAAQHGNPKAYDQIYSFYADKLFRYLYLRLGEREPAEDLMAEVFVRLIECCQGIGSIRRAPSQVSRRGCIGSPPTC